MRSSVDSVSGIRTEQMPRTPPRRRPRPSRSAASGADRQTAPARRRCDRSSTIAAIWPCPRSSLPLPRLRAGGPRNDVVRGCFVLALIFTLATGLHVAPKFDRTPALFGDVADQIVDEIELGFQ